MNNLCVYFTYSLTHSSLFVLSFRPWHVFVDTSPDTDADFEVAATFDEEPSQDDVNFAIVECLEGSEREDELVAQQMQQALEAGQLDRVSEMLGMIAVAVPPNKDSGGTDSDSNKSTDIGDSSPPISSSSSSADGVIGNIKDVDPTDDENYYDDFEPYEEDSC